MAPRILLVDGSTLFALDLEGGKRALRRGCEEVTSVAPFGEDVVTLDGRAVFYTWAADGASQVVSRGWQEDGGVLACLADRVLLAERGVLFELSPEGGSEAVVEGLGEVEFLGVMRGRVYGVSRDTLWELDPSGWGRRVVHRELGGIVAMACARGRVYVAQGDGNLYAIEPASGVLTPVVGEWPGVRALAGGDDVLVGLLGTTICAIEDEGEYRVVSREWENVKAFSGAL